MSRKKADAGWLPVRMLRLHLKLVACLALGALAIPLLPSDWPLAARLLGGWDLAAMLYLATVFVFVTPYSIDQIKRRAAMQDEGASAVLILAMLASFASLAALIALLGHGKNEPDALGALRLIIGTATIILSWMFMHLAFTLHYAHEYYGDGRDDRTGGLNFPGRERPDYWDFLYFSLVIAMTSQVSDVAITSRFIRRVATLHGVISFFFNLGILALTINMLAGAIG
jgi:uncharacterized membrane protein